MFRLPIVIVAALAVLPSLGCAMCCTPFDDAYPTYGGKWQRTDRFRGRVGSVFDPAGPEPATTSLEAIEGKLEPTPASPDEIRDMMPPADDMNPPPADDMTEPEPEAATQASFDDDIALPPVDVDAEGSIPSPN